ncbi:hypothetical protein DQ237_07390 [Blastococcus sp. TF02-8]|uniref:LysM peptidoglycan-binding domain-containing protein n=1 Tax=Blastococcus sp. TF02-8 TaxID=2250574 RepID=UPI000DEA9808|nr:hypothetical protein [Blastococcus sp. TF02-8]RBY96468.1 hypothetical protein DQ237_07390 [Blastococcus sp. TF02-8]
MSPRRLLATALTMAAGAALLTVLTPSVGSSAEAFAHPQTTVDALGADALVLHLAGLLAWLVWAWGVLGLALTGLAAVPGLAGDAARTLLGRLLPAGARRAAALALGVGLGITPPALGLAVVVAVPAVASAQETTGAVPDWPGPAPTTPAPAVPAQVTPAAERTLPDWPEAPAAGGHVVLRGDCLWDIAGRRLADATGTTPTTADVARAVQGWWQANADVIGPDPDLLLPGQVLRPPVP